MPELRMPKLGLTMEEGRVAEWKVAPGEAFAAGGTLLVVETDKIASEVEATEDGTLEAIVAGEGAVVPVGGLLAQWRAGGTGAPSTGAAPAAGAMPAEDAMPAHNMPTHDMPPARAPHVRVVATPLARRRARERGVDLHRLSGSGPRGRIRERDVLAATPAPATSPPTQPKPDLPRAVAEDRRIAPDAWQRIAAERMVLAKATIPHFYLSTEVDAAPLEAAVVALRAAAPGRRITATHLLLFALGRALAARPQANRVWRDGVLVELAAVDLGLAVATPHGLAAPIVPDCGTGSIWDIAAAVEGAAARAREGRLAAADLEAPAAMTLSNAGMHDVTQMISIIPPGQSAILGVGSIRDLFRPDGRGAPKAVRELVLSLSCDHRVFDGVSAIALLDDVRRVLRDPFPLLLAPAEKLP